MTSYRTDRYGRIAKLLDNLRSFVRRADRFVDNASTSTRRFEHTQGMADKAGLVADELHDILHGQPERETETTSDRTRPLEFKSKSNREAGLLNVSESDSVDSLPEFNPEETSNTSLTSS